MNKKIQTFAGGLLVLGTAVFLYPLASIGYSKYMSDTLREHAGAIVSSGESANLSPGASSNMFTEEETYKRGLYPEPAPDSLKKPAKGGIIGILQIPSLQIEEAILEGTDQPELAKAPGHLSDSVLPGQVGKSIIAAHNATTFRHIDKLTPGTKLRVTTEQGVFTFQVTGQRILNIKDELPDTAYPALSLETCYPLNALYYTDQRLFVESALIKSEFKEKARMPSLMSVP